MSGPAGSRFTAWLDADERAGLHELAVELGTSDNYVLRSFLRFFLGMPVSPWTRELVVRRDVELVLSDPGRDPTNEVPHFERVSA